MAEKLSIIKIQEELEKGGTRAELAGAFARALANYVPMVGPILAEAISVSIPQQRLERLIHGEANTRAQSIYCYR